MNFLKQLIKNNVLIVHFEVVVAIAKFLLTVAICWFLKGWMPIQIFWITAVWITLSILVEVILIFAFSKFPINLSLSESEQQQYKITSNELVKYLKVSPKIRLFRNLTATLFVLSFIPSNNWNMGLMFGVVIAALVFDPLCKKILSIREPFIYKPYSHKIISSLELHKNDPSFFGSNAWNATHRHRKNRIFGKS